MAETVSIEVGKDEVRAMLAALDYQKTLAAGFRMAAIRENDQEKVELHTQRLESVKTAIATLKAVEEEAPMD